MNQRTPNKQDDTIGSFYMGRMRPPPPPPKRVVPKGLLTFVALLAFVAIIWYAYPQGQEKYENTDVPLIKADVTPYKFKPDDPGGMEVRHQDSTVFDPLEKKGKAEVEKLMPAAEEPVTKDAALQGKPAIENAAPQLNLDTQMQKVADGTEKVIFPAAAPKTTSETKTAADKKTPDKSVDKAVTDKSKPTPKPAAKTPDTKQDTKSDAKADVKTAETKKTAAPSAISGGTYVRLGSYRNRAGAEQDWTTLKKKYPQYLGGLGMRVVPVDLGAKGTFNRLEAGGVSEIRAREICAALAKTSGGCIVVK